MSQSFDTFFHSKYTEFCDDLLLVCPELSKEIGIAKALSSEDRKDKYLGEVYSAGVKRKEGEYPGTVLPGTTLSRMVWTTLSAKSKKAVFDYLSLLDLFISFENTDASGNSAFSREAVDKIMKEWRSKLGSTDFKDMADKFTSMFGMEGDTLPPLPEQFLKGKLAKLAEDMVREIKPEDFGISPADVKACEEDPTRSFEILIQAATRDPTLLQGAMHKVAKKLQNKIQSGQLKPEELAAEAEELMKVFQGHPAFVQMMKSFRDSFTFDDKDTARSVGRDGENRLSIAKARLRKKLEERKKGKK